MWFVKSAAVTVYEDPEPSTLAHPGVHHWYVRDVSGGSTFQTPGDPTLSVSPMEGVESLIVGGVTFAGVAATATTATASTTPAAPIDNRNFSKLPPPLV